MTESQMGTFLITHLNLSQQPWLCQETGQEGLRSYRVSPKIRSRATLGEKIQDNVLFSGKQGISREGEAHGRLETPGSSSV